MNPARFNLPATLLVPATAALLATSAMAANHDSLLLDVDRESEVRWMTPTPYMIGDRVVLVGPTMEYATYDEYGGDAITANYFQWRFETEDRIIEAVKSVYGEDAVDADGGDLPRSITTQLNIGATIPAEAETRPVSDELVGLLPEGVEWVALSEHLIALDADGRIAHIYWDMLPLM